MSITKKIIFFGTSEFAAIILEKLVSRYKINVVVTQPDRPAGRKQVLTETPVKETAKKHHLKILQPQNLSESQFLNQLDQLHPEVGILAAYAEMIPQKIIDKFSLGILNLHPSLLPKYRGASPIQSAILNGDEVTGVSIIKLTEKLDAGPILIQEEFKISSDDNNETLQQKLAELAAEILIEVLPEYLEGQIKLVKQDESKASYTKKITRQDGQINWQKSAQEIERQFRAYFGWPGVFTYFNKKRLKISDLELYNGEIDDNLTPGEVFLSPNNDLLVKCGQGAIALKKIQLEGKKERKAGDFVNGYGNFIGSILK